MRLIDAREPMVVIRTAILKCFMFMYLPLTLAAIENLFCSEIDGNQYLVVDKSVRCYTSEGDNHTLLMWISWLMVVVLGVGFPLSIFVIFQFKIENSFAARREAMAEQYDSNGQVRARNSLRLQRALRKSKELEGESNHCDRVSRVFAILFPCCCCAKSNRRSRKEEDEEFRKQGAPRGMCSHFVYKAKCPYSYAKVSLSFSALYAKVSLSFSALYAKCPYS